MRLGSSCILARAFFVLACVSCQPLLAGAPTLYSYDSANRLTTITSSATGTTAQLTFDANGNLSQIVGTGAGVTALSAGTSQTIQLTTAGSNALLSFTAPQACTCLALSIGGISTVPSNAPLTLSVYDPTGQLVTSASTTGGVIRLPQVGSGTYTVIASLQNSATGSFQISLGKNLAVISVIVNDLIIN